jgi:3-oxoacyl-[acyl-carrier protein] reductase
MLLENKTAVIYGGGGGIGGAMAQGFAAEGARVVLVGRTPETLDAVAAKVRADGGQAETAVVDALDEAAVNDHADSVVGTTGSLDVSVNVISQDAIFRPLADIPVGDFAAAIDKVVRSQLITTKAAARHMVRQQSGVILFFGGADYVARKDRANMGTVQVGMDVVEAASPRGSPTSPSSPTPSRASSTRPCWAGPPAAPTSATSPPSSRPTGPGR